MRQAAEEPGRRDELLEQAARAADAAVDLQDRQPAPYKALADLARALGNAKAAEQAEALAKKYEKNRN